MTVRAHVSMRLYSGVVMRKFSTLILFVAVFFTSVFDAHAQTAETIWIQANATSYKTGETVTVLVNGTTTTPIQGFTAQIRYDPACLQPVNSTSPISGMTGLAVPQVSGLVDASFASTTPQTANGVLAEVRFTALKDCQTSLTMETAALVIRNESGFAAPLAGVTIGGNNVALNIDKAVGVSQPALPVTGSALSLKPTVPSPSNQNLAGWMIGLFWVLFIVGAGFVFHLWVQKRAVAPPRVSTTSQVAAVHFKHGPYAGKSFRLNKLPVLIGRDPMNDLCLNDPHVLAQHAKIFTANNGYYLMGLGGETFVNGHAVRKDPAILKPGDVVRLGKSALFVFGL